MTTPAQTVFGALAVTAKSDPGRTAIVFEGRTVDYAGLMAKIEAVARHLCARGITKGAVFAAYGPNRPELMYCYYAAARLGAVFVPVNPNLTPSELAHAYRHSRAAMLFCDGALTTVARTALPDEAIHSLDVLSAPAPALSRLPEDDVQADDVFLIIYTSGTTGTPKAIVLDHAAQMGAARALTEMWGVSGTDTTVVALPLGYLYGLSTAAAVGLQAGGTVVILRRFHPRDVLEALASHRATIYHGVPTMFTMMLEYGEERGLVFDLSHMRVLVAAGAPLSPETCHRFKARFGADLQNYYALSEATPVFGRLARDPLPLPEGAVGRAAPGLRVRIVRPDGEDCAEGEQGEILVRAAATMRCYLRAPEQTAAAFKGDLFRTGDLGRRDAEGNYFITGRIKEIIIRGGANISPAEVEAALSTHPAVQEVAVVGAPDHIFGEVPVAFIVPRAGRKVSARALEAHAANALADFKVPRRYFFEPALPVGKTGKIDKPALSRRLMDAARASERR